jgi:integrase
VARKTAANPRQIRVRTCGCPLCTEKFRPGEKATRRDCTGSWQARYLAPGGKPKAKNFDTKKEAEAHIVKMSAQVKDRTWIDPARAEITVAAWHAKWWPAQKGEEATLDRDERMWRNWVEPHFGHWRLADISYLDVQVWVNGLDGPLAPGSVIKAFQILDRMLTAALRDRRIPFNPADGVKMPKQRKAHPEDRRPPSYAQLRAVRRALPRYHFALQIVAQETGLRWGELAGLRACWVDLDGARIQVREVLTEVRGHLKRKVYPKADASLRTVPLTPLAVRVLRVHLAEEQPSTRRSDPSEGMCEDELVFHGRNRVRRSGEPGRAPLRRSAFWRLWIKAIKDAGVVRVTVKQLPSGKERKDYWPDFHDQRHAYASRLAGLGVPEVIVQEVLGHERAGSVTWLYTHAAADVAGQVLAAMRAGQPGARRLRAVA